MKMEEAKDILSQIDMPKPQQNDMCCRVLLALADLKEDTKWEKAKDSFKRTHDIIEFLKQSYDFHYAENSRETVRKAALKPFRDAAIVETNGKPTNSPNYAYRLTTEFLELIRSYKTDEWEQELAIFKEGHETLVELFRQRKKVKRVELLINGQPISLSLGKHNRLQKAIVEDFGAIFAPGAEVLYLGDTQDKFLYRNDELMNELSINVLDNMKLPDVILYMKDKNWIFFVEAVSSVGPMSPSRVHEIKEACQECKAEFIFVTAFKNLSIYKKFADQLAWETEVWIAEMPEHMIHLNGDKFLGPRKED